MARGVRAQAAKIVLAERSVPYLLQRSPRRRTVVLSVDAERGLVVYCPHRIAQRDVEKILREKSNWILEKTAQMARQRRAPRRLACAPGRLLPYRGAWFPLAVTSNGRRRELRLKQGSLCLGLPPRILAKLEQSGLRGAALRAELLAGYREAARDLLTQRVAYFAARLGVQPRIVRVKDQRRRWGSASAKAALNFNWRLVLAPPPVLDYVVVHELCHLLDLNHSPRFWARVASLLPDYRVRQEWLRDFGPRLYDL